MATVKVLYLKNLTDVMTEEKLKEIFEPHGEIEKVKKLKNYAFVHFKEREKALAVSCFYIDILQYHEHLFFVRQWNRCTERRWRIVSSTFP